MGEKSRHFYLTYLTSECARRSVAGNLVVLHFLGGSDQSEVRCKRLFSFAFLNGFGALVDQTLHSLAGLRLRLLSQQIEDFPEPFDMRFGLMEVLDECL